MKSTVQINFLVDYEWLSEMYQATGNEKIPLLILHGEDSQHLRSQSFISLIVDLHQDTYRVFFHLTGALMEHFLNAIAPLRHT